jgi:hypothetical protein
MERGLGMKLNKYAVILLVGATVFLSLGHSVHALTIATPSASNDGGGISVNLRAWAKSSDSTGDLSAQSFDETASVSELPIGAGVAGGIGAAGITNDRGYNEFLSVELTAGYYISQISLWTRSSVPLTGGVDFIVAESNYAGGALDASLHPAGYSFQSNRLEAALVGNQSTSYSGSSAYIYTYDITPYTLDYLLISTIPFFDNRDTVNFRLASVEVEGSPVPEPATMLMLGTGLVGLAGMGRKKLKMKK